MCIRDRVKSLNCLLRVCPEEFLGLPDVTNLKIRLKEIEHIKDVGNAPRERKINGLYFLPVGKGPVADHQGVGVSNACDEI